MVAKEAEPCVEKFQEWLVTIKDESYWFFYHVALDYLLAFKLLTEGARKNNSERIMAARVTFAPLFYSFHHPKYQYLHIRDLWQRAQMPSSLQEYIESNESFSVSGKDNCGQGGDFVHEELNKRIKLKLPPIMPTEEVWTRVCRKLNDLEELHSKAISIEGSEKRYKNI